MKRCGHEMRAYYYSTTKNWVAGVGSVKLAHGAIGLDCIGLDLAEMTFLFCRYHARSGKCGVADARRKYIKRPG